MAVGSTNNVADWATIISSVVQAIATVVLVWVTIKHIGYSKKTIESMDNATKSEFLPILKLGIFTTRSNASKLFITLENSGKGLAKRPVKVCFPGIAPIYVSSVAPGESKDVTIEYNIEYILQEVKETDRKICIEYHDIFSRIIKTEAQLIEVHRYGPNGTGRGIGWDTWTPIIP